MIGAFAKLRAINWRRVGIVAAGATCAVGAGFGIPAAVVGGACYLAGALAPKKKPAGQEASGVIDTEKPKP